MHGKGHCPRQDPVSCLVFDSHALASGFVLVPDSPALRLGRTRNTCAATVPRAAAIQTSAVAPFPATGSYTSHMLIRKASGVRSSAITPKSVHLRRREFLHPSSGALE